MGCCYCFSYNFNGAVTMIKKALCAILSISLSFLTSNRSFAMDQEQKDAFTQNEAYMSCVSKERIKTILKVDPDNYQHFFEQSNRQERNFPQHYSFFHGQHSMNLILYALQKHLVYLFENKSAVDFLYLRARNEMVKDPKQIAQLLQGCSNDCSPQMRKVLLSVNLSIPGVFFWPDGKSTIMGESTLQYLASDNSHMTSSYPSFIRTCLSEFDDRFKHETTFTNIIIAKIIAVMQSLAATQSPEKGQILLQIFIPKNKVDETVYLSLPYGTLYTEPIRDAEAPEHPLIPAWDDNKKRYSVSALLHMYRNRPQKLAHVMPAIQARIVVTEDLFAHSENGIKIFLFTIFSILRYCSCIYNKWPLLHKKFLTQGVKPLLKASRRSSLI